MNLAIKEMLLIDEPTVQILKDELMKTSEWFILPSFVFALCLEYFGDLKFYEVVKKLILILVFMGAFYSVHKTGVDLSFKVSEEILRKVSPRNVFLRSWTEVKVKTQDNASWNWLQKFSIPNINDLVGTAFFLLSKVFIWILKLIYSTVYHLTYVFAPLTAVLYFFPITRGSISGTIQSSLWCMVMPIVLVSILAIVGNSIQVPAHDGSLVIVSIDHILWLFGVTLLLLMSPILTLGILRGGGVAMSGSAIGVMMTSASMKLITAIPHAKQLFQTGYNKIKGTPPRISQFGVGKNNQSSFKPSLTSNNSHKNLVSNLKNSKANENLTNVKQDNLSSFSKMGSPNQNVETGQKASLSKTHVNSEKLSQSPQAPSKGISTINPSSKPKEVQLQNNTKKMEISTIRNNQANPAKSMEFKSKTTFQRNSISRPKVEVRPSFKASKPVGVKNEIRNI